MKTGSVQIFAAEDLEDIKTISDRKQAIHCCKYSPCGNFLAVGSNDNRVDFYSTESDYEKVGCGSKASSFITQLDWSNCSNYVAACDGAGERLIYDNTGKHITSSDTLEGIEWDTVSGVIGTDVDGVFPKVIFVGFPFFFQIGFSLC
jgi:WD40 repeat protein